MQEKKYGKPYRNVVFMSFIALCFFLFCDLAHYESMLIEVAVSMKPSEDLTLLLMSLKPSLALWN